MLVKLTPGEWHLVKKQTFNFTKTANVQFSCKQTCSVITISPNLHYKKNILQISLVIHTRYTRHFGPRILNSQIKRQNSSALNCTNPMHQKFFSSKMPHACIDEIYHIAPFLNHQRLTNNWLWHKAMEYRQLLLFADFLSGDSLIHNGIIGQKWTFYLRIQD